MPLLNTATSIVDYLKSKGFRAAPGETVPLYDQRRQIYESSGLGTNLGDYRGTAQQNTQLLSYLTGAEKTAGVSLTPENLRNIIDVSRGTGSNPPVPMPTPTPPAPPAPPTPTPPAPPAPTPNENNLGTLSLENLNAIYNPLEGRDIASEALTRVQSGATFGLQQEDVRAKKAALELKAQADTQDFINKIASRGLFFSGKKSAGVSAIESQKLADLLGIDLDYATVLAKGIESSAKEIVKEAQEGSKEAISALEKMGYVINPITGTIEPTLTAKTAAATQANQAAAQNRAAQEFAMKYNITKPYYKIGTTVYRTSDQHPYSSEAEFFADTNLKDWPTAQKFIQTADPGAVGTKTTITSIGGRRVILTYDDKGNVINKTDLGSSTSGVTAWQPTKNTAIAVGKTNQDGSLGYDFFYVGTDGSMKPITKIEYENYQKLKSTASNQSSSLEEIAKLLKQQSTTED